MNALYNFAADSFTQRNFVADFLQAKCDFTRKWPFAFLSPPFGGLGAKYDDHFRLIRNENEKNNFTETKIVLRLFCLSFVSVFTALHGMQTRSSDENSVCTSVRLSVCLSVCHTRVL